LWTGITHERTEKKAPERELLLERIRALQNLHGVMRLVWQAFPFIAARAHCSGADRNIICFPPHHRSREFQSNSMDDSTRLTSVLLDMFSQRYPSFFGGFLCRRRFIP
jgi:hypothetical protein